MFWKLSFMTSLWRCLRSTTLACWQCTSPPACLPHFFSLPFFSHTYTHTQFRGKNDLSAALNSLHFYRPEWTCSTKGDIIFSGFDWPPPCHRMTSCKPSTPPPQPAPAHNQPPLVFVDAGLPRQQGSGQDLAVYCGLAVHNELGQRCVCCKQSWEMLWRDGKLGVGRGWGTLSWMQFPVHSLSSIGNRDVTLHL